MPYVQCKTYKQRNECAKYTIYIYIYMNFVNENSIKKTLHPQKKKHIESKRNHSRTKNKQKEKKNKKKINIEQKLT